MKPVAVLAFFRLSFAIRAGSRVADRAATLTAPLTQFPPGSNSSRKIQRYFPSISQRGLLNTICRVIADPQLIDLVRLILESHAENEVREHFRPGALPGWGLPIGNLTSQFFANVMLDPFDHFVTEVVRPGGYVRSMDDFLLFGESRDQLREMGKQARERLASLELQIHPDKYRLVRTRDGVDFVGFRALPTAAFGSGKRA